jgi:hypothetical protein
MFGWVGCGTLAMSIILADACEVCQLYFDLIFPRGSAIANVEGCFAQSFALGMKNWCTYGHA